MASPPPAAIAQKQQPASGPQWAKADLTIKDDAQHGAVWLNSRAIAATLSNSSATVHTANSSATVHTAVWRHHESLLSLPFSLLLNETGHSVGHTPKIPVFNTVLMILSCEIVGQTRRVICDIIYLWSVKSFIVIM